MLNFTFELQKNSPYYLQIYKKIATSINSGKIKANEKLPSKRKLAKHLNVSTNTILNAYNLLLEEGYILSLEKKGYFVVEQPQLTIAPNPSIKKETIQEPFLYDLTTQSITDIDFSFLSFNKCVRASLMDKDYILKSPLEGLPILRKAIAEHLLENRGIEIDYHQIIIGNGLEMIASLFPLISASSYALENPGYHKLAKLLENNQLNIEYVDLDQNGVKIPQKSTVLYTTPFNQFPTGIKMSIIRKKELIHWAEQNNGYIIEDDFDAEFRINDAPTTALYSFNPKRVIFFSSFSSTLFAGAKIAYMILPEKLLEAYQKRYEGYSNPVSSLDQTILYQYIMRGEYAKHINRLKNRYLKKRETIKQTLKNTEKLIINSQKNFLSMLISVHPSIKMNSLLESLKKEKIKINAVSSYDAMHREGNVLIIGYTNIDEENLKKALSIIKRKIEP